MSELLFECYSAPSVAYGVDALFSYLYNSALSPAKNGMCIIVHCVWSCNANAAVGGAKNGLVISSSYQATHILPVVDGRLDSRHCKR